MQEQYNCINKTQGYLGYMKYQIFITRAQLLVHKMYIWFKNTLDLSLATILHNPTRFNNKPVKQITIFNSVNNIRGGLRPLCPTTNIPRHI